jgi:uncharacterized membrane protein
MAHHIEWEVRGEEQGTQLINYGVRILGRHGVMRVTLICTPDQLQQNLQKFRQLLRGFNYVAAESYSDWHVGDEVSKYGLIALVTGAVAAAAKTGLLAAALKAVILLVLKGKAIAKLYRRDWGETVDNVAGTGEYHWMAGNFLKYGGHWDAMPVDSHELIALCAPRPVFISGGATKGDGWVDAKGMFMAAAAGPVYKLLG